MARSVFCKIPPLVILVYLNPECRFLSNTTRLFESVWVENFQFLSSFCSYTRDWFKLQLKLSELDQLEKNKQSMKQHYVKMKQLEKGIYEIEREVEGERRGYFREQQLCEPFVFSLRWTRVPMTLIKRGPQSRLQCRISKAIWIWCSYVTSLSTHC